LIAVSPAGHPAPRDIEGHGAFTGKIAVPDMHAFTSAKANANTNTNVNPNPNPNPNPEEEER
jgi:hypothetical protein